MDYSEIVVILDRSGSMQTCRSDHEGGLQSFVRDQKELPGDVRFTLIQFDSGAPCEVVYDGVPIADVKDIVLTPRGGTPLLDAVGMSLAHVEKRIGSAKPDQVLVMIVTDGQENASHEWTRARVQARIAELEKGTWKFLYLGANTDAFAEAGALGVQQSSASNFSNNSAGVAAAYACTSGKLSAARSYVHSNKLRGTQHDDQVVKALYSYTPQDRTSMNADQDQNTVVTNVVTTNSTTNLNKEQTK